VPGFPVARGMVAGGEYISLVAAGAAPLYELQQEAATVAHLSALEQRFTRLEDQLGITSDVEDISDAELDDLIGIAASGESDVEDAADGGDDEVAEGEDTKKTAKDRMAKLRARRRMATAKKGY